MNETDSDIVKIPSQPMYTSEPPALEAPSVTIVPDLQSLGVRACFVLHCWCSYPRASMPRQSAVDIETAAKIYQDAAIREQVRASLGAMPAHIRQLFSADTTALSDSQLNAVAAAAKRGFRIDVFEALP